MDRLLVFGDSWPLGVELNPDEQPYGRILADSLDLQYVNCAIGGASNEQLVLQLRHLLGRIPDVKGDIAVFFITSASRTCVIDFDGSVDRIHPSMPQPRGHRAQAWYKHFHTPLHDEFRTNLSVLALQKICSHFGIHDHYVVGWSDIDFQYPGISREKIYAQTCAQMFGVSGEHEFTQAQNSPYVYPNLSHPNQAGHQLIAEKLAEWISTKWKK